MSNARYDIRVFFQPAFLICVAVLVGAEIIRPIVGAVIPEKEPLPLKKSLDLLDQEQLAPYKVVAKPRIENEEIVKELGTEEYVQLVLEDTEVMDGSPVKSVFLFITYYELPDRVPHVPEECWVGGGWHRLATDGVTFEISRGDLQRRIPGKYLVFGSTKGDFWQSSARLPVLYFFRVNGVYAGSRDEARVALNKNLFRRHSYFCKVELAFNQALATPDKQEAVRAAEKVLAVILPILEAEYWPD
jgi:hypothetical protein